MPLSKLKMKKTESATFYTKLHVLKKKNQENREYFKYEENFSRNK